MNQQYPPTNMAPTMPTHKHSPKHPTATRLSCELYNSSLGQICIVTEEQYLVAVYFQEQDKKPAFLEHMACVVVPCRNSTRATLCPQEHDANHGKPPCQNSTNINRVASAISTHSAEPTSPIDPATQTRAWLDAYFRGEIPTTYPPRKYYGTEFQLRVWRELEKIPYGLVQTYGDLARALASSPRAVGGAVGRNPISILTPCHRIVGANRELTGFACGLKRKVELLKIEGYQIAGESETMQRWRIS